MKVLVINSGSSSLKYQLFDQEDWSWVLRGNVERIGEVGRSVFPDHSAALEHVLSEVVDAGIQLSDISVVGHRVVHGGELFVQPTLITNEVLDGIESLTALAPLHNPANLTGIRAIKQLMPSTPQVAVFDTAFHSSIPSFASTYAISAEVAARYGIRRYGFHGTSAQYVTKQLAGLLDKPLSTINAIICHIGNGASITAVVDGMSVDTSMGMTPLEGLVMGTRSGDIDAGVLLHLARVAGYGVADIDRLLNRDSGLQGLAGVSDMRTVRERAQAGDEHALLARSVYAYRIRKYIASYLGVVPSPDAIVFTAGVGENDSALRHDIIGALGHLGLELDLNLNESKAAGDRVISSAASSIRVMVVQTNEELEIAQQAASVVTPR